MELDVSKNIKYLYVKLFIFFKSETIKQLRKGLPAFRSNAVALLQNQRHITA